MAYSSSEVQSPPSSLFFSAATGGAEQQRSSSPFRASAFLPSTAVTVLVDLSCPAKHATVVTVGCGGNGDSVKQSRPTNRTAATVSSSLLLLGITWCMAVVLVGGVTSPLSGKGDLAGTLGEKQLGIA
nr:hypothetical protein Iba_chr15dCG7900 [Ipomoea batatas]